MEVDSGDELESDADAAELGGEDEAIDDELRDERPDLVVDAEALADGGGERMVADGAESAGHFGEEDDADGAEDDSPDE